MNTPDSNSDSGKGKTGGMRQEGQWVVASLLKDQLSSNYYLWMLCLTISLERKRLCLRLSHEARLREKVGFLQRLNETNNELILQKINPDQWWQVLDLNFTIRPVSPAINADVANPSGGWMDYLPATTELGFQPAHQPRGQSTITLIINAELAM